LTNDPIPMTNVPFDPWSSLVIGAWSLGIQIDIHS
jgi:hypothetical protein